MKIFLEVFPVENSHFYGKIVKIYKTQILLGNLLEMIAVWLIFRFSTQWNKNLSLYEKYRKTLGEYLLKLGSVHCICRCRQT